MSRPKPTDDEKRWRQKLRQQARPRAERLLRLPHPLEETRKYPATVRIIEDQLNVDHETALFGHRTPSTSYDCVNIIDNFCISNNGQGREREYEPCMSNLTVREERVREAGTGRARGNSSDLPSMPASRI